MDKGKVFISSILNRKVEDLHPERNAVREVVETYRFLKPWAFEKEPASSEDLDESYLHHVDECDLFILIVGRRSTDPVTAECLQAKEKDKRILLFAKSVQDRTPQAKSLLALPGVKYAPFDTMEDLQRSVRDAIDQELLSGLRTSRERGGGRSTLGRLRQLAEKQVIVRIRPTIPHKGEQDSYQVEDATVDVVVLKKLSSNHTVRIPPSRVSEILALSDREPPVLTLEGRLQWLTLAQNWKFFDEKPDPSSPLGFAKSSNNNDPQANAIIQRCRDQGFKFYWDHHVNIGAREADGWELVYDEDGRYFRIPDRPFDLILIRKLGG